MVNGYNQISNVYKDVSDEELIERYRSGESDIMNYLLDKYKNLVLSKSRTMHLIGGEPEDLIQEGMIGLFQAINDYDFGRDASFFTFAELCVYRKMYNATKNSRAKKHSFLNNYISFFESKDDMEQEMYSQLVEVVAAGSNSNPEKLVLTNELKEEFEQAVNEELTDLERECISLYITGIKNSEIARIIGRSPKETENAIQRAKTKLKKIISRK